MGRVGLRAGSRGGGRVVGMVKAVKILLREGELGQGMRANGGLGEWLGLGPGPVESSGRVGGLTPDRAEAAGGGVGSRCTRRLDQSTARDASANYTNLRQRRARNRRRSRDFGGDNLMWNKSPLLLLPDRMPMRKSTRLPSHRGINPKLSEIYLPLDRIMAISAFIAPFAVALELVGIAGLHAEETLRFEVGGAGGEVLG